MKIARLALLIYMISAPAVAHELEITSPSGGKLQGLGSSDSTVLTANQAHTWDLKEPVWFRADDRIPVLIVPADSGSSRVVLDPPKSDDFLKAATDTEVNAILGGILVEISSIQDLMRQKMLSESRARLTNLMKLHPKLGFLNFLLASQLLLEGDKRQALAVAESALQAFPNYEEGKKFVEALKGTGR